jgi:hypothetical protein
MKRLATLVVGGLLLLSCASPDGPRYLKAIAPLSTVPGRGLSLEIPDEEGWSILDQDGKGSDIVKFGRTDIESYVISLDRWHLDRPVSDVELRELYEEQKSKGRQMTRYKYRVTEELPDLSWGKLSIGFYYFWEDYGAVTLPAGEEYLLVQAMGIVSVDPYRPNSMVLVSYSYRYAPGHEDPRFHEKARWVLDHIVFTKP